MLTLKNVVISLLLISAIGLSGWSIYISKKTKPLSTGHSSEPDAFMENVIATIINDEGVRTLLIESPKMIHYADNDTTHILSPHIVVYRESPEPWHINASFAKASQGIEKIFFSGNVVIHHSTDDVTPRTTMKTDTLTVFPKKNIAETNDAIIMLQPDTTIRAIGMLANLNDGVVKLISAARGEYVPQH